MHELPIAEREDFQQRERLLSLFVKSDVLDDGFGCAVLRNDERLSLSRKLSKVSRSGQPFGMPSHELCRASWFTPGV